MSKPEICSFFVPISTGWLIWQERTFSIFRRPVASCCDKDDYTLCKVADFGNIVDCI
ncbi:hypothetical protein SIAM614_13213 [Stappia aggregata IAM 12614]|uniref:Uncharacterized protein n=1 Tax=Roseibium aggregatum (strain ATCC 25650 / DSM 13394 / JCM 20685 / NBRC 16684 / NCIMB 2208 / IAM 12614 / B1) TaxID=384765 RepID=A0NQB8_ROSAI|nr:hypothetical protein SIAM614_13213 [Stappia aggregata IAM 12614] [Roseibium aggregatum IAM 12614]